MKSNGPIQTLEDNRTASLKWWLGAADIVAVGVAEGASRIGRAHIAIADESFDLLSRFEVTRPVSESVRVVHHGISRLCYGSIGLAARAAQRATGHKPR